MPPIVIRIDRSTLRALDRIVPPNERPEFLRNAIRSAVRVSMESRTRESYAAQPDSESEADDWSAAELFKS
ncbi:MAG: hypothetical protein MUC42_13840 [Bryobacter sp.]|jgi:hypothetical protein|nr:hypothetical protein [Bryobacter sp.]